MTKIVMDIVSYIHSGPMQDVLDMIDRMGASAAAAELVAEASAENIELADEDDLADYLGRLNRKAMAKAKEV